MKIGVQHKDGLIETLSLVPPFIEKTETCLLCGDGTNHFFDLDGYYDGWGRAVGDDESAEEMTDRIQGEREIDPP